MLESRIERYLGIQVKRRSGIYVKLLDATGIPDRLVILQGIMLFVELKREAGRLAPAQTVWHKRLRDLGCEVRVVWSIEDVDRLMRELDEQLKVNI